MWRRAFGSASAAMAVVLAFTVVVILLPAVEVKADIESDRKECTDQLMAMSTCLNYVSGSSKMPTRDCCSGLKEVLKGSPKCLCLLIKDNEDPSLSLKIDPARALSLPDNCHSPANISHCPNLLHLSPDSPDAKIFKDFGDATHGNKTTTTGTSTGTSALMSSGGGGGGGGGGSRVIGTYHPTGGRGQGWLPGLGGAFWVYWVLASLLS